MKTLTIREKLAVKEFKQSLFNKLGDNFVDIFLFGSKARGEATKESDIDILVIVKKKNDKIKDKIRDIQYSIILKKGVALSSSIYDQKTWQQYTKVPTSFSYSVNKDAIRV